MKLQGQVLFIWLFCQLCLWAEVCYGSSDLPNRNIPNYLGLLLSVFEGRITYSYYVWGW